MQTHESSDSFKPTSFRAVLQDELLNRCHSNPNYSLRSFARSLKVEPSALSQIINGKRPLTEKMKLRLGSALGYSIHELEKLPLDDREKKGKAISRPYQQMAHDTFAVISDWYHYAILELTYIEGFQSDASWIARKLGITKSEANIGIERLFRLGLLKKKSNGKWVDASDAGELTHLAPDVSSTAGRKYQMELLELSKKAVQEVDLSNRNHTSATICFDPEDMVDAIEAITSFRRKFAQEFQPRKKAKAVYQLQISFFPLTKKSSEEESL
jgi:plasmid maintenance system antidote protein VapI